MPKHLISLLIVTLISLNGSFAFAKVSSGEVNSVKAQRQDLIDLLPENSADDRRGPEYCDLRQPRVLMGEPEFPSSTPFAHARSEQQCVFPVPPRDIFENIAWLR